MTFDAHKFTGTTEETRETDDVSGDHQENNATPGHVSAHAPGSFARTSLKVPHRQRITTGDPSSEPSRSCSWSSVTPMMSSTPHAPHA